MERLYTYVGNDPLDKTDPTGLECSQGRDRCYAETHDQPNKEFAATHANSWKDDRAMHDNKGKAQVKSGDTEKLGYIEKDGSFRASSVIAASVALTSARIALNAVAGAAIGAGQVTGSKVAATGSLPTTNEVTSGAAVGAVGAGVSSAAGEAAASTLNTAAGWIGASAGSSAATKSLVGTIKATTLSAATDAEKAATRAC